MWNNIKQSKIQVAGITEGEVMEIIEEIMKILYSEN